MYKIAILLLTLSACSTPALHELPAKGEHGVMAVVETPAGSAVAVRYHPVEQRFLPDSSKLDYLPFPCNWGFVPSTRIPHRRTGGFAPVELLILGQPLESGRKLEVRPVAAVVLSENGRRKVLVLATPLNAALGSLSVRDFPDLLIGYPGVKEGLELWLRQKDHNGQVEILDWKDGNFAMRFIEASLPKKNPKQNNK